ncbi:MAG: GAF domain-containing SpoIIE family protein phosphatase [Melioribacteraceae bacterium]|nr:GAF domain-containing SpoIIE family protein phosphatase [Melioribacteraceae bacterium]
MALAVGYDCSECQNYTSLANRLIFFNQMSQKILEKKPLVGLLDEIIGSSKLLLNAEAGSLLLFDKQNNNLYFHIVSGEKRDELKSKKIKLGEGIAGWVAAHKKPLKIDDCYIDKRFNKDFDIKTGFKTRNMICVPMLRKNELVGVIQAINKQDAEHFSQQDVDLFSVMASECALAIENARLSQVEIKTEQLRYELSIAHAIQQRILPDKLPVYDDIDLNTVLIPAKEVGGDYYNVIKLNKDESLFIIADVSGKSISAALIVATIYSFLQTYFIINHEKLELKLFVEALNRFLISSTTQDKFATAWLGLYNHKEKKLESINAGHNPILLLKKDETDFTTLTEGGLLLGSIDLPYESETIELAKDDLLIFYTDGVTEAMNENEEEYGDDRFSELIKRKRSLGAAETSVMILDDIRIFCSGNEQSDDITFGIMKVK